MGKPNHIPRWPIGTPTPTQRMGPLLLSKRRTKNPGLQIVKNESLYKKLQGGRSPLSIRPKHEKNHMDTPYKFDKIQK
jgi:hypothetical protein